MKLKNVKRGVRVELKSSIGRLPVGVRGTLLEYEDTRPFVQWDNFTDGHSGGSPTVPKSSWSVDIQYLRRIKD